MTLFGCTLNWFSSHLQLTSDKGPTKLCRLKIGHNIVLRTNALFKIGTSLDVIAVNINKYPKRHSKMCRFWIKIHKSISFCWLMDVREQLNLSFQNKYLIFYLNWQCKYCDPYFLLLRQKNFWHFFSCAALGAFVKTGKFASSTKIPYEILTFLLKISKLDFAMIAHRPI